MATKTEVPCAVCGAEVTAKDPVRYPYCEVCHYTGRASEHARAEQVARFREAFPDARFVGVEHTGGGCFWFAFRWDEDETYYIATDGGASLPAEGEERTPMATGGWGVVCRYSDSEDESNPDYDGTPILTATVAGEEPTKWPTDRFWTEYPAHCLSDEQVVAAIRADRAERSKT